MHVTYTLSYICELTVEKGKKVTTFKKNTRSTSKKRGMGMMIGIGIQIQMRM